MAVQKHFWPILLLVLTMVVSMTGCVEEGPPGEPGPSGPAGPPGEVIVIPPGDVAPLLPDVGLTPQQAQPRVSFDPALLPPGTPQAEIAGSPASLRWRLP